MKGTSTFAREEQALFSLVVAAVPAVDLPLAPTMPAQVVGPDQTQVQTATYLSPGIRWAYYFPSGLQIVPGIAALEEAKAHPSDCLRRLAAHAAGELSRA